MPCLERLCHHLAQVLEQQLHNARRVRGGEADVQRRGALQRVQVPAALGQQVVHAVDVGAPAEAGRGAAEGAQAGRCRAAPRLLRWPARDLCLAAAAA